MKHLRDLIWHDDIDMKARCFEVEYHISQRMGSYGKMFNLAQLGVTNCKHDGLCSMRLTIVHCAELFVFSRET